ncbi:MAG: MscS [Bacillota bacterium]|jgi:MscS family membrane protein|nr:MscS [Bacillota bacterium]
MSIFISEVNLTTIVYSLIILFVALLFKNFVAHILIDFIKRLCKNYNIRAISTMIDSIEKPLRNFLIYTGVYFALSILPFNVGISSFIYRVYRAFIIISIARCLLNLVSAYSNYIESRIEDSELSANKPVAKTVFPLINKIVKSLIVIIAVVAIAVEFNFEQLNSILAGVGIGGAALALASQDLIKNFFGGIVVLTDKSFSVGDIINVDSKEGTVEELGLRSTKIRTVQQEVIVIPNAKFTEQSVTNISKRNFMRVSFKLGAPFDTSKDKLQILIEKIKKMLDENEMVKENSPLVKFDSFSDSALLIIIQYLILTTDYNEFMDVKEKINFKVLELFEEEKITLAYPSLSLYMEKND